jgi:hypothetical protein
MSNKWSLIERPGGQIADTGDYDDGCWEITDGTNSLFTTGESSELESDELKQLVNLMNELDLSVVTEVDDLRYGLYIVGKENSRLWRFLHDKGLHDEFIKSGNTNDPDGYIPG